MSQFKNVLNAWGTPEFTNLLQQAMQKMDVEQLCLQQGLTKGSYAKDNNIKVMILNSVEQGGFVRVRAGIFYTSEIAGCNCADDPTPVDEYPEYCEVQLDIYKQSAKATVTLLV